MNLRGLLTEVGAGRRRRSIVVTQHQGKKSKAFLLLFHFPTNFLGIVGGARIEGEERENAEEEATPLIRCDLI